MSQYQAPIDDINFLMFEVFDLPKQWGQLCGASELDAEMASAVLGEIKKICEDQLAPINRSGDEAGCHWQDGNVASPGGFKEAYQTFCEGGWCGLSGNVDYGGMAMPKTLSSAVEEMVQGANMAWGLAPMLTAGACLAIDAHASEELKQLYLPKLYSGQWSGAMDLTEPHAGTDLGLIRSRAHPQDDGSYLISGSKIFITWGEHDMSENIVHLVLAKLPDAPPGSKGISMFLVPKFIPNQTGEIGARNSVNCGSIEKKMGIKASATCVMNFDNAVGWLVGELNQGLAGMFTMMNYERLVVGIQAIGAAHGAYINALNYAKERLQCRAPEGAVAPEKAADPIINHPDIRRQLSTMKAYVEGSRAFYFYVAQFLDGQKYGADAETKALAERRVALLTPIAKAFISDLSLDVAIMGQQIYGGHGYIREWGQEQYVRDIRITQIYEGTNGIQAMDLMGRKTLACKGQLWLEMAEEILQFAEEEQNELKPNLAEQLKQCVAVATEVTQHVIEVSQHNKAYAGAVAYDYMHLIGHVLYAYMWAKMAVSANNNSALKLAKNNTAEFYFTSLLTKNTWLAEKIKRAELVGSLVDIDQF